MRNPQISEEISPSSETSSFSKVKNKEKNSNLIADIC